MNRDITRMVNDYEHGRLSRRQLIAHMTALVGAAATAPLLGQAPAAVPAAASTFRAKEVDHVALRVTDIDRSRRWYEKHLGLETTSCDEGSCFLRCGSDFLALFRGQTAGLDHYAFGIDGYSAGAAVAKLEAAGLTAKRRGDRVYFDDPDGLEVQVSAAG